MKTIDYFMSPSSPWTYLGHARLVGIAQKHGAAVRVKPIELVGTIFPQTGGLPVPKRSPQRQAYRLLELKRWREYLDVALVLQPSHFPLDPGPAAQLICAVPEPKRMALAGELLAALWKEDRDIGDAAVLREIGDRYGVAAGDPAQYEAFTAEALARGIFGAPSYLYRDELFWGQDRLDFLDRALGR